MMWLVAAVAIVALLVGAFAANWWQEVRHVRLMQVLYPATAPRLRWWWPWLRD